MKRVAALVAVAAMIVAALWSRDVFDRTTDGGGGTGGDATSGTIVCATELAAVCESAFADRLGDVRSESPGATADQLAAGEADWAVWVVSEPWPAIAELRATEAGEPTDLVGTSPFAVAPLRLVVTRDAEGSADCPAADAGCHLDSGLAAGIAPADTTDGLFGVVALAAHVTGVADFATNDLGDGPVEDALARVAASAAQSPEPVLRLLTVAGAFDVAVGVGATVPPARADRATAVDVEPPLRARAVVVGRDRRPASSWADRLRGALEGTIWTATSGTAPASGLPGRAGAIDRAVRMWDGISR